MLNLRILLCLHRNLLHKFFLIILLHVLLTAERVSLCEIKYKTFSYNCKMNFLLTWIEQHKLSKSCYEIIFFVFKSEIERKHEEMQIILLIIHTFQCTGRCKNLTGGASPVQHLGFDVSYTVFRPFEYTLVSSVPPFFHGNIRVFLQ